MASIAQKSANQKNSTSSTGPTSSAGKSKMHRNPVSHGLTATHLIVGDESPDDFNALHDRLVHDHHPTGEQQEIQVKQIAESYWRLLRARRVETDTLNRHASEIKHRQSSKEYLIFLDLADEHISRLDPVAATFIRHGEELDRLRRYETAIERAYYRAINQLLKLQAIRKKQDKEEEKSTIGSASKTAPPPHRPAQIAPEIASAATPTPIHTQPDLLSPASPTRHLTPQP